LTIFTDLLDLNVIKVYFQTFDNAGNYTGEWVEFTKYVKKIGSFSSSLDSSDYQIGVFENSNLSLSMNNNTGLFSDSDSENSFFTFKRPNTKVRITYQGAEFQAGVSVAGDPQGEEIDIFRGLLNDDSYRLNARDEIAKFKVLGFEGLLDNVEVNFSSLSNGDTISTIMKTILNQSTITDVLTYSDSNINVDTDAISDAVADLENLTVSDAMDQLLLVSNSVMYITGETLIVSPRDAGATSQKTFYGQASQNGAENISALTGYNNGIQRVFNFFTWKDEDGKQTDSTSITDNGMRKEEIDFGIFTDTTKQNTLLASLLAEFKDKKIEFNLTTPLDYTTLELALLDRVTVDYPTTYIATEGNDLPLYGASIYGEAVYPAGLFALIISDQDPYKIIKKKFNLNRQEITFKLREI